KYGIDKILQPFGSNAPPSITPNQKIQTIVAAIQACHIHSLDVTKNMRWVFTGGEDGFIRKYDFFSSMRGKTLLTQNQKHTQVELVQKAGVIEIPISLPVVVKPGQINIGTFRPITHSSPSSQASIQSSPTSLETVFEESDYTINHFRDILLTTSIDDNCFIWDKRLANFIPRKLPVPEKTPPWCLSACWSADGNKIYCGRPSMPNNKHIVCASTDNIRFWNFDESDTARSIVPFLIIPGYHGGTISQICILSMGWEGSNTEAALFYEIIPIV
ncbi:11499_t:CDS:2, partial [Scutellospora calospora]